MFVGECQCYPSGPNETSPETISAPLFHMGLASLSTHFLLSFILYSFSFHKKVKILILIDHFICIFKGLFLYLFMLTCSETHCPGMI